jgi:2-keto-myo-inositol isomerase
VSEFTLCLNTSTIRPTPLLEKIAIAGRAGYQAIEPWNDEITAYLDAGGSLPELRKAIAGAGLKVVSVIALTGWATSQGLEYGRVLDVCKQRMEQAAALGSPYIVASPPDGVVDLGRVAARFGELARVGRSLGVDPSMEFLGFVAGIKSVADAWAVASGCGEPDATVVADVFHMIRGGGSVDDLLMLKGSSLACFHINDVPSEPDPLTQSDHDRVMIGDGIADLPRVIANLRAINYNGPLSLELFNRALWDSEAATVAGLGVTRLRSLVESPTP